MPLKIPDPKQLNLKDDSIVQHRKQLTFKSFAKLTRAGLFNDLHVTFNHYNMSINNCEICDNQQLNNRKRKRTRHY